MNYLQLSQRAIGECGEQGSLTTTVGAIGSQGRIVNWVADSWNEIQMEHNDWSWMRSSNILGSGASFTTIAGQASYPLGTGAGTVGIAVDSFGKWDMPTFRNFGTVPGVTNEIFLDMIDYDTYRDAYMFGAMRAVQSRPPAVAIGPDQSVNLGPPPTSAYTVTADYFVAPTVIANDTDIPVGIPTRFHMLIVYRAMQKYAGYESAGEVMQRATYEYGKMIRQLEFLRLPPVSFGGALA